MDLNNPETFKEIDASDMFAFITDLPDQFEQAWARRTDLDLPAGLGDVNRIVVCGMGGSAISGALVSALVEDTLPIPIISNRSYDLPAYATDDSTLVVLMSHSGTTEETLSCARQAVERGTKTLAVTTGGDLAPLITDNGGGVVPFAYDSPPRAALGWLYGSLLAGLHAIGILPDLSDSVAESVELMREGRRMLSPEHDDDTNKAKRMAGQLVDRTPIIWGGGLLEPVANRWKTQINENAKSAAYFEAMPELNHNAVVGTQFPENVVIGKIAPVHLRSRSDHPRVAIRHKATQQLLRQYGIVADSVMAQGDSRLAQQMTLVQFGDYVSYYLAMAYGIDPTPIEAINSLKQQLAEAG
ncbi:MAG: bifunctional phosphoglucose/phosphomannose isomerase [Chloroflexi bacterium]|nr:bifunctional phosphoglucose/phosphomannose isomerase [Chloroflexota bacterium]